MVPFVDLLRSYRTIDGTRGPGAAQGSSPWWLPLSWERPREFFAALWTQAESALGGPAKSQPEVGIDFYADLVTRHLHRASKSAAVRWHEPAEGWQSLTLWQLDEQARALASILVGKGLQPGEHLALVLPSGASMVVGIMAALSVGSVAIPVLPLGRTYVQRLLADSKAKQVVTCSPYTALHGLLDYQPLVLSKALLAQAGAGPPSVTYAPDAPALLVRSPLRAPDSLLAVTAADSYCSALRDGLLLFGLRPGERLATPATPQYAPATYLAALLCGAGLTELSAEAVRMDASPLYGASLRAVVLTQAIQDSLSEVGGGPVGWGGWFRDPQEGFDVANWERADERLRLSAIPHANLLWDAASGGAVMVSELRRGPPQPYMAPAPGCAYLLGALYGDGPTVTDVGRLLLLRKDGLPQGSPGEALLLRTDRGYMYGGTALPRRAGWSYPSQDVQTVLTQSLELSTLVGATVVELGGGGRFGHSLFVVVLFTGSQATTHIDPKECAALIERELGPGARPDRVEIVPLFPRRQGGTPGGAIDSDWVREQYVSSGLYQKAGSPLFRTLTKLRAALLQRARG